MVDAVVLGTQTLHGADAQGARWVTARDQFSWDDGAGSSVDVEQNPRSDGGVAGSAYLQPAHPVVGGTVYAATPDALEEARDRLKAACTLAPTILTVQRGTQSRRMTVQRQDAVIFTTLSPTKASWSIQLLAPDPRKYGAALTGSTGLPASTGGVLVPATFPITFAETITSGHVTLTNLGNIDAPVTLRLSGPAVGSLVGPIITHWPSGKRLSFGPDRFVPAGESWVFDCATRQVLAGGTQPRTSWLSERGWPVLSPGVNVFGLTAMGSGPDPSLSVSSWSAWQ